MLYCPKCTDVRLCTRSLKNLPYMWCYKCDSFSFLGRITKNILQKELLADFEKKKDFLPDSPKKECSCCRKKLKVYVVQNKVEIDICAKCSFLFLDKDEYKNIALDTQWQDTDESAIEVNIFDVRNITVIEQLILDFAVTETREKRHNPQPIISWSIVVICLIIYKNPQMAKSLVLLKSNFSFKTLIGSFLTHIDLKIMIMNIVFFLQFGTRLERIVGQKRFAYLLIFTMLSLLLINKFITQQPVFIGFSALTFSTIGVMVCLFPKVRFSFVELIQLKHHLFPHFLNITLPLKYYGVICLMVLSSIEGYNSSFHILYGFIGFVVGYVYAYYFFKQQIV